MSPVPESVNAKEGRLELDGRKKALYEALAKREEMLAQMYLGALCVHDQKQNPDRFQLAAHGIRELLEKLPAIVGVVPQRPEFSGKCQQLANKWDKHAIKSDCYEDGLFSGTIDDKLHKFLQGTKDFIEWFRGRPNRSDERAGTIRALDQGKFEMPAAIEKIRTQELAEYARYFTAVSHHSPNLSESDFIAYLDRLEDFLLDFLRPRTFDDHDDIDVLIQAGEKDA